MQHNYHYSSVFQACEEITLKKLFCDNHETYVANIQFWAPVML
jgi:hypothetical protein